MILFLSLIFTFDLRARRHIFKRPHFAVLYYSRLFSSCVLQPWSEERRSRERRVTELHFETINIICFTCSAEPSAYLLFLFTLSWIWYCLDFCPKCPKPLAQTKVQPLTTPTPPPSVGWILMALSFPSPHITPPHPGHLSGICRTFIFSFGHNHTMLQMPRGGVSSHVHKIPTVGFWRAKMFPNPRTIISFHFLSSNLNIHISRGFQSKQICVHTISPNHFSFHPVYWKEVKLTLISCFSIKAAKLFLLSKNQEFT